MINFFRITAFLIIVSGTAIFSKNALCNHLDNSPNPTKTSATKGPHGGKILKSPQGIAELKMDANNKKIHIYLPKHPEQDPKGINVTLYDENNRSFSIDLKKLEQQLPGGDEEMTHYQGQLNPAQTSYMGIQISIPFSKNNPTIIEDRQLNQ